MPDGKQTEHLEDASQELVIGAAGGEFLVLAPPGCGKTHVLAERVLRAGRNGTAYGDMLCLTFTNRAARGMTERIREIVGEEGVRGVYVGNIHRYCSRFLIDNAVVPEASGIIDGDDILSVMAHFLDTDEDLLGANNVLRRQCRDAVELSAVMYQIEHGHPRALRMHAGCLSREDVGALKYICEVQKKEFNPGTMSEIYRGTRDYKDIVKGEEFLTARQPALTGLLDKMDLALKYRSYKEENMLLDFDDLLLETYEALRKDGEKVKRGGRSAYKHYTWCQVDEVQDLNPLQLAIVDLLMVPRDVPGRTVVFLGDEQQAIFSFMGAKMETLGTLKKRCGDRIFRLGTNHRSPSYLLEVFNTYAREVMKTDSSFLPASGVVTARRGGELAIVCSATAEDEYRDTAALARRLELENPEERTAVIVLTNKEADEAGRCLDEAGVKHFKVSGADVFSSPEVKLLTAHLSVFASENNFIAWSRLLKGFRVYERNASARTFVRQLSDAALSPADLLLRPGSSYVREFARAWEEREIVVFDTETTGLDVYSDDIVQIAAVKMRKGEIVEGSAFSVFIETDRDIPLMLGDIANPVIEERKKHELLPPAEALGLFTRYAGGAVLLGHNADYDYRILGENLKRHIPDYDLGSSFPVYFDTLKLSRLLRPGLSRYKLKYLLEILHLEGENSHLADADVLATCSLAKYCHDRCLEVLPRQGEFLNLKSVKNRAAVMRREMLPFYTATLSRLGGMQAPDSGALLAGEMRDLYSGLLGKGYVSPVRNIGYVFEYISRNVVDMAVEKDLLSQIKNHIIEISTLRESDLANSDVINERTIVTTVHKAKGLEFENVIVFDACGDRYPGYYSTSAAAVEEDKRKLYVALTRAKKRIFITLSARKPGRWMRSGERTVSPFLEPVAKYFEVLGTETGGADVRI